MSHAGDIDLPSARSLATAVTESVRALGGRADRATLIQHAIDTGNFSQAERDEPSHVRSSKTTHPSELHHRMGWALSHAKNAGMLVNVGRGIWALPG
jgi:hypothetical protein